MTNRIWVQYHSSERMNGTPVGDCIWTKKRVPGDIEGDVIFLIEGSGKPRQIQLWSWHIVEGVERFSDGRSEIHSKRQAVVNIPLGGFAFSNFKIHRMLNFSIGFTEISSHPYAATLVQLSGILDRIGMAHPLVSGNPPEWASGWGQDEFGIFADLSLAGQTEHRVEQRLRWIPPGAFTMGEGESARYVIVPDALWIFDTPCTQALWQAVMPGDNPSYFDDSQRPVEQVSWDDTQRFMKAIQERTSAPFRLPAELEWEYCCRAGTTEATYAGSVQVVGTYHAPELDPIAYYGGNCGVGFDLNHGYLINWRDKQYNFDRGGTRKVANKLPNAWGLFDMLGNVCEWCADLYVDERVEDPDREPHLTTEQDRVIRGGSWRSVANAVSSSFRSNYPAGHRLHDIGFRCVLISSRSSHEVASGYRDGADRAEAF